METIDYGETDLHSIIEGDRRYNSEEESYGEHGFSKQEFDGEELVDIEEDLTDFDATDDIDFEAILDEEQKKGVPQMTATNNETSYQPMTFDAIKIGLASPEKILDVVKGRSYKT